MKYIINFIMVVLATFFNYIYAGNNPIIVYVLPDETRTYIGEDIVFEVKVNDAPKEGIDVPVDVYYIENGEVVVDTLDSVFVSESDRTDTTTWTTDTAEPPKEYHYGRATINDGQVKSSGGVLVGEIYSGSLFSDVHSSVTDDVEVGDDGSGINVCMDADEVDGEQIAEMILSCDFQPSKVGREVKWRWVDTEESGDFWVAGPGGNVERDLKYNERYEYEIFWDADGDGEPDSTKNPSSLTVYVDVYLVDPMTDDYSQGINVGDPVTVNPEAVCNNIGSIAIDQWQSEYSQCEGDWESHVSSEDSETTKDLNAPGDFKFVLSSFTVEGVDYDFSPTSNTVSSTFNDEWKEMQPAYQDAWTLAKNWLEANPGRLVEYGLMMGFDTASKKWVPTGGPTIGDDVPVENGIVFAPLPSHSDFDPTGPDPEDPHPFDDTPVWKSLVHVHTHPSWPYWDPTVESHEAGPSTGDESFANNNDLGLIVLDVADDGVEVTQENKGDFPSSPTVIPYNDLTYGCDQL